MSRIAEHIKNYLITSFPRGSVHYHHVGGIGLHVFKVATRDTEHTIQFSDSAFENHDAASIIRKLKAYQIIDEMQHGALPDVVLFQSGDI